jgi:hypothetical protein
MASNLVRKGDLRRETRHPLQGSLRILWENSDGREMISRAQVVDVSPSGLKLRLEEKIPIRTYVSCNEPKLGLCGRGSVRYCHFAKGKFDVGIEFTGGSGWRLPPAP